MSRAIIRGMSSIYPPKIRLMKNGCDGIPYNFPHIGAKHKSAIAIAEKSVYSRFIWIMVFSLTFEKNITTGKGSE